MALQVREYLTADGRILSAIGRTSLVLLLTGGAKSTQSQDILRAQMDWRDLEAKRHGKAKR